MTSEIKDRSPGFVQRLWQTWVRFRALRRQGSAGGARGSSARCKIDVLLVTYNHERYIRQAIESVLMQKGDFDLKLNIIDDASTDNTGEIAREYERAYPGVVFCYINERNVGHAATQLNTIRGFRVLSGHYFAILEGDDYWTDPRKLMRQLLFLESHPDYVACGHDTLKIYEDSLREPEHFLPLRAFGRSTATIDDLIGLAAVLHISSIVYRNVFGLEPPLCFADPYSCEATISMVYGQFGSFYHMPGSMSVYRAHDKGQFSTRSQENIWLFHLHGFRRFALYMGPRYWYSFARALTRFCIHILIRRDRAAVPSLRLRTKALFVTHLAASAAAFAALGVMRLFYVGWRCLFSRTQEGSSEGAVFARQQCCRLVKYRPVWLVRIVMALEKRWPRVGRLRHSLKSFLHLGGDTMETSNQQAKSYQIETTASDGQQHQREQLLAMFQKTPLPPDDLLFNIGMYVRSSVLVKFIVMSKIYERIVNVPGCLVEFGVWWGQNLILLENLRAIYEPFNKQRVVLGFDTFEGYTQLSTMDKDSDMWKAQSYSTGKEHLRYLRELLEVHEGCNALGHVRGLHHLVQGDVEKTAPEYFMQHPETTVAFAYFDMALYRPTKAALTAIKPHLISGSILLLDEFTWAESPGEAIAFKEVFDRKEVRLEKCALYPSKTIVTIL